MGPRKDKRGLLEWPIPFVRSLYLAGQQYAEAGDLSGAKNHHERFIAYWREGDLDSQKIRKAKRFIEDSRGP